MGGLFPIKETFHGGTKFFGQIYGGITQSLELWKDLSLKLMVMRFQRSSQV